MNGTISRWFLKRFLPLLIVLVFSAIIYYIFVCNFFLKEVESGLKISRSPFSSIYYFTILFVIFEALFALIVGVLNFYFLKSIIDPVNKINKIAKFIAEGDFSARVKREHDDELGKLCDSVNYMAKELGAAEKTKNDFISSISHELRTPLTSIRGWAEILKNSDVLDFKIMKKAMEVIVNESTRLCSIVEELLDFSSLKNSRLVLNMAKIDVIAELSEAVYIFCKRAEHEKKTFFYIEPEDFPIVFGDKNRLKQVFTNIIDNALKYTEDGKGVISIFTKTQDDFVKITIEDNGCGISEEDLPRIKEKFFKANKTQIGAGIGLALANEIVLAHSGKINIKSQENIGTVVTIFIPISSSDDKHQHIENR